MFESQKDCHAEEVEDLFSELLEGRSEPMKGKGSWDANFGSNNNKTNNHSA